MQSVELVALELSVVLFLAHVATQTATKRAELGQTYMMGFRDTPRAVTNVTAARAERALANFLENYPAFIALDLALIVTAHTGGWGASLWIAARIAYLPIYVAGVPIARTVCWGLGILALLLMLVRLAGF